MIFIPFLYFTLLTLYWWKRHRRLDICIYMSGLYALTSFLAIIIVYGEMLDGGGILPNEYDSDINKILPTFLYCTILTISILPFSMIYGKDLKMIVPSMRFTTLCLGWILIAVSLLNFYLVYDSTLDILQGDLSAVREAHYSDGYVSPAEMKAESLPIIVKYFYYLNVCTLLALPLLFYSLCFEHRSWWYNILLFFASLSVPVQAIQVADRTECVYYGLMIVFCLVFFRNFITQKLKRKLIWAGVPIVLSGIIYFAIVTQARFSDSDGNNKGAFVSAIQYAGQGYINFCYFWEKGQFEHISPEREFPMLWHCLYDIDSNPERRGERSSKHGFFISVFATFIGDIMLDLSPIGLCIWVVCYFILCFIIIKSSHRTELTIEELIAIFTLSVIPIFGIFYYRYYSRMYTLEFLIVALLYIMSRIRMKIFKDENNSNNCNMTCLQ